MSKITVKLDRERELRYSLNAMIQLEEKGDEKLSPMLQFRRMLWAGLIHEDPDLSEEQVGDMLDMRDVPAIEAAMSRAINRDTPALTGQAKVPTKGKPRPPKARKRA